MHHYHHASCRPETFRRYGFHGWREQSRRRPKYNVPINIVETATSFEVHVYATGFTKENIKINVIDNVLYIRGTRTLDENSIPDFRVQEFPIKNFERVVGLRSKIDAPNISARHEEGILKVFLPKSEPGTEEGQEIPVQ